MEPQTITFPSRDGIGITADVYMKHAATQPFILFFHQAGWSRGEYRPIADAFLDMGFNCMAVDQRSGGAVNEVENETRKRAEKAGKGTTFVDAEQDMHAAVEYVRKQYAKGKLVIWGSSYSSALVFRVAAEHPKKVDLVVSFSPGEYFVRFGKSKTWISDAAAKMQQPVFITSAANERPQWEPIYNALASEHKSFFLPQTDGNHGSRALWKRFSDSEAYFTAVSSFLKKHLPELGN